MIFSHHLGSAALRDVFLAICSVDLVLAMLSRFCHAGSAKRLGFADHGTVDAWEHMNLSHDLVQIEQRFGVQHKLKKREQVDVLDTRLTRAPCRWL